VQKVCVCVIAILLWMPTVVSAQQRQASAELVVGEKVAPLPGWAKFCEDYAPVCDTKPVEKARAILSEEALLELRTVNAQVNQRITIRTDPEHWGWSESRYIYTIGSGEKDVDRWNYAEDDVGDCEDIALLKQKILLEKGWPRSALLLTHVGSTVDRHGKVLVGGHLVLMVKTDKGDFILDTTDFSLGPQRWSETTHVFRSRQSDEDPNVWVSLSKTTLVSEKNN
jgi:predicted transglutaminase-like cysteine proteinase